MQQFQIILTLIESHRQHVTASSHLYSPPLFLFGELLSITDKSSTTNHSLKIDVSQDDSSITIKKGENKTVLYHLEWTDTV